MFPADKIYGIKQWLSCLSKGKDYVLFGIINNRTNF